MHMERDFRVARSRDDVVARLCRDETLLSLMPGASELVSSEGEVRTTSTRYELLGREGTMTFHFTYLLDGNLRFEKVCDGHIWSQLRGCVTVEEDGDGATVCLEMDGRARALVPERAIKGPLEEQIESMAKALQEHLS